MKKSIVLEYLSPVEFLAIYTQSKFEKDKKILEELTDKRLFELIAMVQEDEGEFFKLQSKIEDFANYHGYLYCIDHEIYHKYYKCPFCSLGIKKD